MKKSYVEIYLLVLVLLLLLF